MSEKESGKRKYIGVNFTCCATYARIYLNEAKQAYMGRCPRCLRTVKVLVDKEKATTSSRFFKAE